MWTLTDASTAAPGARKPLLSGHVAAAVDVSIICPSTSKSTKGETMKKPPRKEFFDPNPPDELHMAIGRVSNQFALLEYYINRTIWRLAKVKPQLGACITAQIIPIAGRMDALETLAVARKISKGTLADIRTFAGKAKNLSQKRNRILHDTWAIERRSKKTVRLEVTAKTDPVYGFKQEDAKHVLSVANDIQKARFKFNEIDETITAELRSLPNIRLSPFQPRLQEPSRHPRAARGAGR
jgi:hypothetical protein